MADVEGDREVIYRLIGAKPKSPPAIRELVQRLLGSSPRVADIRQESCLSRVGKQWRIYVRRGTATKQSESLIAQECAKWWYRQTGYQGADLPQRCLALAAALTAPQPSIVKALRLEQGQERAQVFKLTQNMAVVPHGESSPRAVALVPNGPRLGEQDREWPPEAEVLMGLAKCAPQGPGIHKVKIADPNAAPNVDEAETIARRTGN